MLANLLKPYGVSSKDVKIGAALTLCQPATSSPPAVYCLAHVEHEGSNLLELDVFKFEMVGHRVGQADETGDGLEVVVAGIFPTFGAVEFHHAVMRSADLGNVSYGRLGASGGRDGR